MIPRLPICLSLLVVSTACALEPLTPDDDAPTPSLRYVPGDDDTCGDECSRNAATIGDGIAFHELDLSGTVPNDQHLRIMRFGFPGLYGAFTQLQPYFVHGDLLGAFDMRGRKVTDLTHAVFELRWEHGGSRRDYVLELTGITWEDFWIYQPGDRQLRMYTFFAYRADDPGNKIPMCPSRDLDPEWHGLQGQAVLFTGDRFWPDVTITDPGPNTRWFNVACVGTAPAKLHLLRHTRASASASISTSREQSQAMLKLLTADYCGIGKRFTEDGHPLEFRPRQPWYQPLHPLDLSSEEKRKKVEALWGPDGATCLNTPRLFRRMDVAGKCGAAMPRLCTDAEIVAWAHDSGPSYGISVNP